MAICNTCHHPRCGYASCNASKTPCPTCQETNTSTPATPGTDIPSANLHVKGLHFVDRITGMGLDPKRTEMDHEDDKMVKSLQHRQDIILIPRHWWSALQNTLGPEEPGWWYTVSSDMWYQGCQSCKRRLGKDHQDATRCPKCPAKISKRKNSGSKNTQS